MQALARAHTDLSTADVEWLSMLLADWQIIADLSFADLVLWLPAADGSGYWAGAQMRPTTGPTAFVDDIVGSFLGAGRRPLVDVALREGRIAREGDPEWRDDVPVRVEAIPVRRGDRLIAVVARNTNLQGVRTPSRLELSYLQTATELSQMIALGAFPFPGQRSDHADTPRVGDGFIRVDAAGLVTYASPNALSVYRKLGLTGDLAGQSLAGVTRSLVPAAMRPDEETVSAVLGARQPRDTELDAANATVILRAIPLRPAGRHVGGLVLLRDVTELRRRDRELVTKDATIREIHHRVKNNLQTVAALLRLQARRIGVPEGAGGPGGGRAPRRGDRGRARDAEPGLRRVGRLRRGGRPADPTGHRRRGPGVAGPRASRRLVRVGVLRRGDAAGDGVHRADPERRPARLRRRSGRIGPRALRARGRATGAARRGRRHRPARGVLRRSPRPAWACPSCSPSWGSSAAP